MIKESSKISQIFEGIKQNRETTRLATKLMNKERWDQSSIGDLSHHYSPLAGEDFMEVIRLGYLICKKEGRPFYFFHNSSNPFVISRIENDYVIVSKEDIKPEKLSFYRGYLTALADTKSLETESSRLPEEIKKYASLLI